MSLKEDRRQDKYGNLTGSYARIKNTMLLDRGVQNNLESLQERWRMIMFMYDDCVEMVKTRQQNRLCRRQLKQKCELIALAIVYSTLAIPVLMAVLLAYVIFLWPCSFTLEDYIAIPGGFKISATRTYALNLIWWFDSYVIYVNVHVQNILEHHLSVV